MRGIFNTFVIATIISVLSTIYMEVLEYKNFYEFYAKVSAEYSHLLYLETLYLDQTPFFCISGYNQTRKYAIEAKEHYRLFLTYSRLYLNTMNQTYREKAKSHYFTMHRYFTKASEITGKMYEKTTGLLYDSFRTLDYIGAEKDSFPGRLRELYLELKEVHRKIQNFKQDKNYYWKIKEQRDLGAELVSAEYLLTQGSFTSLVEFHNKLVGRNSLIAKVCNISHEIESEINKFNNFLEMKKHEIQNKKTFLLQRVSNIQNCKVYTEDLVSFVVGYSEIASGQTEDPASLCERIVEELENIVLFTKFSGEDYLYNEYMTLRNYEEKLTEINQSINQVISDIRRTDETCFSRVEQLISEKEPSLLLSKALEYFKEAKEKKDVLLCYKALRILSNTNETDFSQEFMDLKEKQELLQKLGYDTEYCDFLFSMTEDIYYYGNYSDALDIFLEARNCFSELYSQFLSELSTVEKKAKTFYKIYKRMFPKGTIIYNNYTDIYYRYKEAKRILEVLYPIVKEELANVLKEHVFVSYSLSEIPVCNRFYNVTVSIIVANPFNVSLKNVYLKADTFYGEVPVFIDELKSMSTIYRKLFVKASSCNISERVVYANQYFSIDEVLVNVSSPFEHTCFATDRIPENKQRVQGRCILLNPGDNLIYFNESSRVEYIREVLNNKVHIKIRNLGPEILRFEFIDPYLNFSKANVNFTVSGNKTLFILGTLGSGEEKEIIAEISISEEYLKSVIRYFYNHTNTSLEDSIKFLSLDEMSIQELEQFALDLEKRFISEQQEKKRLDEFSELVENTFLEIEAWKERIGYNPIYAPVFFEMSMLMEKSKKCLQDKNITCVEHSLNAIWNILDNFSLNPEDFSYEIDFICDYKDCTKLRSMYEKYLSGEISLVEFKKELSKEQEYVYQDFLNKISNYDLQDLLNTVKLAFGENSSQFKEVSESVSTFSSKINNVRKDFFNSSPKELLLELDAFKRKVDSLVSSAKYEAKYLLLKARKVFEESINKNDLTSYLKKALDNYNSGRYSLSGYYSKRLIELSEKSIGSLPWVEILLSLGIIGFLIYLIKKPKKEKKFIEIVPGS